MTAATTGSSSIFSLISSFLVHISSFLLHISSVDPIVELCITTSVDSVPAGFEVVSRSLLGPFAGKIDDVEGKKVNI